MAVSDTEFIDRLSEALKNLPTVDARTTAEIVASMKRLNSTISNSVKNFNLLNTLVNGGYENYRDVSASLEELEEAINKSTNATEVRELMDAKHAMLEQARQENQKVFMVKTLKGMGTAVSSFVSGVATATTNLAKELLNFSGEGITPATTLFKVGIDAVAGTVNTVGSIITEVGKSMSLLLAVQPKLGVIGLVLTGLGTLVSAFGSASKKIAGELVDILNSEIEKTVTAYKNAAMAGALFADGLTGIRKSAGEAGLRVDQFADVIKNNSERLASSGMSVGGAAQYIGNVMKVIRRDGSTVVNELLNLGYGFQEQAELVAEVIGDMKSARDAALLDPVQVAAKTREYAENLKVIAAITGEDAKKRREESRLKSMEVDIYARLQKTGGAGAVERFRSMMDVLPNELKKGFMEFVSSGGTAIVDGATNVLATQNPKIMETFNQLYTTLGNAAVGAKDAQDMTSSMVSDMARNFNLDFAQDIAFAARFGGSEITRTTTEMSNAILLSGLKYGKDVTEQARRQAQNQAVTVDGFTKTVRDVQIDIQNFALTLQEKMIEPMKKYSEVLAMMTNKIDELLKEWLGGEDTSTTATAVPTPEVARETRIATQDELVAARLRAAQIEEQRGRGSQEARQARIAAMEAARAAQQARETERTANVRAARERYGTIPPDLRQGRAKGGISRGPISGYLEKLHGTEAVVPLPDGRTIPVSLTLPKEMANLNYVPPTVNDSRTFFSQNLSVASLTAEVAKIKQAAEAIKQASDEQVLPLEIKRTIEMSNNSLKEVLREQIDLMRDSNDKFQRLMDIASDTRNINQQILNTSY